MNESDTRLHKIDPILEKLNEAGYGKEVLKDIRRIIDAEKSDIRFCARGYLFFRWSTPGASNV
jgi:hypothetical protein